MAIATKCTCGYSITGVCTSSVKECRQLISMEENTQLPKEVVEQIKQEGQNMLAFATDNKWSYIQGATAYATKLHLVEQENVDLRQWKQEAIQLLAPIMEYGQGHKDAQLGSSCTEFVLQRSKLYDALKNQPGQRWVKASERLPEKDGYYCFKANGGYMGAYLRTAANGSRWFCDSAGGTIRNWKNCEWLDESPAAGREEDAVAFAEWLYQNRWFNKEGDYWCYTFEQGTCVSKATYRQHYMKTTAELYDIFKKEAK